MTGEWIRIALAQLNLVVGDIRANTTRIRDAAIRARDEAGAAIVLFPELALTSYPPEDLLFRADLYRQLDQAIAELCETVPGIHMVLGHPRRAHGHCYNSASVIRDGEILLTYDKQRLPNYAVFDEKRYFSAGSLPVPAFELGGQRFGLSICEDIWVPGVAAQAAEAGVQCMLNINASPYHVDKFAERLEVVARNATEADMAMCYVNLVGGQDELLFDGGSMAVARDGTLVGVAAHCREDLLVVEAGPDGQLRAPAGASAAAPPATGDGAVYEALVCGVGDYVTKNRFRGAVVGLSGGIDSALTLALAVDALGADQVLAVLMPSRYTAQMSIDDARAQAERLGVQHETISIEPMVNAFDEALAPVFRGRERDVTEENIQARIRGVLLMAISNKTGRIVLTTGNKSEMSVGYATLYGDMAGGFAPLKDVPKLLVYALSKWRNREREVIPERVITRPPSAELAPDQKDEDSLPPYEILDPILARYIEHDQAPAAIAAAGFERAVVDRVARLVDRAEYKRRQAAPGVRISRRAFGRDRRVPITSGYDETR